MSSETELYPDLTSMTLEEKVDEILTRLRKPKPYTSHPKWTAAQCDNFCQVTQTPIPTHEMVEINTDEGIKWGHPGLLRMMADNDTEVFYMAWIHHDAQGNPQIDPSYLETPPTRRGRPPGTSSKEKKSSRVEVDMKNYTLDDVPHMKRTQLLTACTEQGVSELVKNAGAAILSEGVAWLMSALKAKMTNADKLPPFESKANKHVRPQAVPIPKPIVKTVAPPRPSPAGGVKLGGGKGLGSGKPVTQAPVSAPVGRKPLQR